MIKGRMTSGSGRPILLLGLTRENCARLLDDKPIHIGADQLQELGLPDGMSVVLIGGETEASISVQLGGMPLQPEVAGQRFLQQGKRPPS